MAEEYAISGDVACKSIALSDGSSAFVDADDFHLVQRRVWHPAPDRHTVYARCSINNRTVRMHRLIVNAIAGQMVDHVDGNGLNNCRSNLRIANAQQNAANQKPRRAASGYKGVYKVGRGQRWRAIVTVDHRLRHLGYFDTPEAAAIAYDMAAAEEFGHFSDLNFPAAGRLLDGRTHDDFPTRAEVARA